MAWILTMVLAGLGGVLIAPLFTLQDFVFTLGRARLAGRGRARRAALDPDRVRRRARCSAWSRTWSPATATTSCPTS